MERDGEIRLRFLGDSPVSTSKYLAFLEKGWGPGKLLFPWKEEFAVVVNFDEFRSIVRASRNKTLVLEYGQGKFGVDHCPMRTVGIE